MNYETWRKRRHRFAPNFKASTPYGRLWCQWCGDWEESPMHELLQERIV